VPSTCLPNPRVSLFNANGSLIETFEHCQLEGKIGKVSLTTSTKSGVFFVQLTDKQSTWSGKIMMP
jgi:hypothetical protein